MDTDLFVCPLKAAKRTGEWEEGVGDDNSKGSKRKSTSQFNNN